MSLPQFYYLQNTKAVNNANGSVNSKCAYPPGVFVVHLSSCFVGPGAVEFFLKTSTWG